MEALKQIANIAGYSGLYRILKPGRAGVIVESLDDKKTKTMMGPTARVSVLKDISIYIDEGDEQSVPLSDILQTVADKYGDELPVDTKASNDDLADFMASVVPNYDRERVRPADIKKLISWYGILRQYSPESFSSPADASAPADEQPADVTTSEEPAAETPKA